MVDNLVISSDGAARHQTPHSKPGSGASSVRGNAIGRHSERITRWEETAESGPVLHPTLQGPG